MQEDYEDTESYDEGLNERLEDEDEWSDEDEDDWEDEDEPDDEDDDSDDLVNYVPIDDPTE